MLWHIIVPLSPEQSRAEQSKVEQGKFHAQPCSALLTVNNEGNLCCVLGTKKC